MNISAFVIDNPAFWVILAVVLISYLAFRLWITRGHSSKHHGWQGRVRYFSSSSHYMPDEDHMTAPLFPPSGERPQSFKQREEKNR